VSSIRSLAPAGFALIASPAGVAFRFAVLPTGQRLIYGLLAAAAGMFCGACSVALISLLMWGGWTLDEQHSIVVIFGWTLAGFIAAMIAVIVGLLAGGPVGRFRLSATRDGASVEADCDETRP
jgi:hypothetical protein